MALIEFIKLHSVLTTICAATLSTQVVSLADVLTNNIVVPIIDHKNNDHKIEGMSANIGGVSIGYGKLLIVLIKIIIVLILLYIIFSIIKSSQKDS